MSMEQLQELFLATQGIKNAAEKMKRPKFVMKKQKFFWTEKRVDDLKLASAMALQKFKVHKKCGIGHYMYQYWLKLNPGVEVSKSRLLARHNFQIRYERRYVLYFLKNVLYLKGVFQLEFVIISRVINHMTSYDSSALIS